MVGLAGLSTCNETRYNTLLQQVIYATTSDVIQGNEIQCWFIRVLFSEYLGGNEGKSVQNRFICRQYFLPYMSVVGDNADFKVVTASSLWFLFHRIKD